MKGTDKPIRKRKNAKSGRIGRANKPPVNGYLAIIIDANEHRTQYTTLTAASAEKAYELVAEAVNGDFSVLHVYQYNGHVMGKDKDAKNPKIELLPAGLGSIAIYALLRKPLVLKHNHPLRRNAIQTYLPLRETLVYSDEQPQTCGV